MRNGKQKFKVIEGGQSKIRQSAYRGKKVTWEEHIMCSALGQLGISAKCIIEHTGIPSKHLVYGHLYSSGIRLGDYRNGLTPLAQTAINDAIGVPVKKAKRRRSL